MPEPILAYSILATIIALILGAIFYLQSKSKEEGGATNEAPPVRQIPGGNRATANRNARDRLRAVLAQRRGEDLSEEDEDDVSPPPPSAPSSHLQETDSELDDEREDDEPKIPKGKIGKKKAAKLEAKAEKRAQRLAEEREREEQKEQDAIKAEEDKLKEEEEAAEEERRLVEERKIQEERECKEQEEYEKMKAMFTVDESGFDQVGDDEQEKDLLKEFVEHIKSEKVVVLEELAARFRLKTQAVINRVTDLLADGTLSGVLDDRGKFIYISPDELDGFAKFIRQRGRVTLSDLAEASGTLISLTPDTPQHQPPISLTPDTPLHTQAY